MAATLVSCKAIISKVLKANKKIFQNLFQCGIFMAWNGAITGV